MFRPRSLSSSPSGGTSSTATDRAAASVAAAAPGRLTLLAALEDQLQLLERLRGVIRRAKARGGLLVFARVVIARLPPGALDNALRGEGDEAQVSVRRQR